jgi:secondary thiamine-phosphate synthase enzyme
MLREIPVKTERRVELVDVTAEVRDFVKGCGGGSGAVVLFVPHTTAGVTINEGADPDVRRDIVDFTSRLIPERAGFAHAEGNSDAHVKSSLFSPSLTCIVEDGELMLGTWQAVYFAEFDGPRKRSLWVKFLKG